MDTHLRGLGLGLAVVMIGSMQCLSALATAQTPTGNGATMPRFDRHADLVDLPIVGTWRANPSKSTTTNPYIRSGTFTWIFEVEGDGIRHSVYEVYPAAKPSRSYWVRLNGQEFPDPHGPGIGFGGRKLPPGARQTISWWPINRWTILRDVKEDGVSMERVIYAVSPDGRTFSATVWQPHQPDPRGQSGLMVFDRQ